MTVSDYIAKYIEKRGVTHVFELVGGMITFLLDSLHRVSSVQIVSMHHEQGAGFAAEGYGRIKGIPGVAMATSGPGATNLVTAIGSCYFDSTPAVFITGQVNRHEQKGERAIRQLGFQETDIVSVCKPLTKAAWLVSDPVLLPELLEKAFALAIDGRPGPVLIDIPLDVQRAEVGALSLLNLESVSTSEVPPRTEETAQFWECIHSALRLSLRPLILAGGGIQSSRTATEFKEIARLLGAPVVHSLMAVDALEATHPLRVGLIGSYGNRWANIALFECDFLLVLGSRLDVRQTGADTASFRGERRIFHVDCEPGEMNNRVTGCSTLVSELASFLDPVYLNQWIQPDWSAWVERIHHLKDQWPDTAEVDGNEGINPNKFMHLLSNGANQAAGFVVDVGQHQMWAAQSLQLIKSQRFMTSGGMGAMGFALPAAIGACLGCGGRQIVMIAGDGGFQLNIQELETIFRLKLPIKMIVINNQCHGMVRQFQESYFKARYQSTVWGYSAPSFVDIASAYQIPSLRVSDPNEVDSALERCFADLSVPYLLEVVIRMEVNAYPKMAFGRPISEMEPFAKPLEMEGT